MRGIAGALVVALLGGCSAFVPPLYPTCKATSFDPEPALDCEAAVTSAADALPGHGPITEAEFMHGGLCPPNARCMPPDGTAGTVIFTFSDGRQLSVYVHLDGSRIVADEAEVYPPPWLEEG
jgi:hypothetical protein